MEFTLISAIEQCATLVQESVPLSLIYYSHFPAAIVALLLGFFVLYNNRTLSAKILFMLTVVFSTWCIVDVLLWTSIDARAYMFFWSFAYMLEVFLFVLSLYFFYTYVANRDVPNRMKFFVLFLIAPVLFVSSSVFSLPYFDVVTCIPVEGLFWSNYIFPLEIIIFTSIVALTLYWYKKGEVLLRQQRLLVGAGVSLFLFSFFFSGFLVDWLGGEYLYEIIGLLGMVFFIGVLAYVIVIYRAFNIKLLAAQALVASLVILIGAQFFFIQSDINRTLNGITFALAIGFGFLLVKSVEKEVKLSDMLEVSNTDLENANEKLKGLDKLKTEFLSLASHQLRSPLTAIKGYASMLVEGAFGPVEAKQSESIKRIYSSAQGLANIVEDLLNVSKIEQGGMKYEMMPTELAPLVDALYNEMKIPAENKGLAFTLDIPNHDSFMAIVDPLKIKQVFLNLTDNSIKYTPSGFVKLSLSRKDNKIFFAVADTGVGVTAETKAKLFEKFSRGEGGKLNTGGSGLGLYLAQEITKAHKGQIIIESEGAGKGTTFVVELPAAGAQVAPNVVAS